MFILVQSVTRLFLSLIPIAEILFLSYVLGYSFHSFPFSMVLFLFLLVATYLHSGWAKSVTWAFLGFVLFTINMKASFFSGLLFALLFGGIRFTIHRIRRRWKT